MTRKQMLMRLEEALVTDGVLKYSIDNTPVPIDDKMIEELAEFVLETVERAGMLPPKYYCLYDGNVYDQWECEE